MLVFDRPVFKDWAFWHGIGWGLAMAVSTIVEPIEGSTTPWLDVPGMGVMTFFMIGWPVAGARRLLRGARKIGRRGAEAPPPIVKSDERQWAGPTPEAPPEPSTPPPPPPPPPPRVVAIPPPIPLSGYRGGDLPESQALTRARRDFPYPVARAARAVQTSQDPLEQYQYLLDLGEALTLALGMLSASWLRQLAPTDPSLETLYRAYLVRGVSQGHWHEVIKAAERMMAKSDAGVPGFVDGVRSRKGQPGVVETLKDILAERNRAAHGARPHNRAEAAAQNAELAPIAESTVARSDFLADSPWALVEGVSLRRNDRRWNVRIRRAMGDHPDFDAQTQVLDQPLANDTFYVMVGPEPLDLTPMLVMRYCDQCRQPEVCHADRVDEKAGVSLKSFARGHQVFDRDLVQEVDSLVPTKSIREDAGS